MSSPASSFEHTVEAIRLAIVGAADDKTAMSIIDQICLNAPSPLRANAPEPTRLLLDAMTQVEARFVIAP